MLYFDENKPVNNGLNRTELESVTIEGLFGKRNVTLDFDKTANIFIGENGLGKTTILNCVYYILTSDYEKLVGIPFNSILIKFRQERSLAISKADVIKYVKSRRAELHAIAPDVEMIIEDTIDHLKVSSVVFFDDDFQEIIITRLRKAFGMSYQSAKGAVLTYLSSLRDDHKGNKQNILNLHKKVSKVITDRVIYLTTYRRIEKDYSEYFNYEKGRYNLADNDSLIHFGMEDVSRAINSILRIIRDKTNQNFYKMTGILLSKYVSPLSTKQNKSQNIDCDLLQIVLDRLGALISERDKKNILTLVSNTSIYEPQYQYLLNLINELIQSYNQLQKYDDKIIQFMMTCNKYLNNKQFRYNQSEISLKLYSESEDEIELSMLSSGEKQIVSLFSKLYLESEKKCILLIDEPELSISMRWQRMLLPDIMRSNNCSLLLTVTHSPFIFDNEFDNDAIDMWYCFDRESDK